MRNLYAHVFSLTASVENWRAALLLYQASKIPPAAIPRDAARRWQFIAAHECILELYNFRARLAKIQSVLLKQCPSVRPHIDMGLVRDSRKKLDELFPDAEAMRHAVAHKGENEAHPEVHAPDGRLALSGFREPDRYSLPYEGKLRHLDMTDSSLEKLTDVLTMFVGAFSTAARELERQGHLDD